MIPTLFEASYVKDHATLPDHGLVDLIDCLECMAEQTDEDDSSEWEMAFTYPLGGQGFEYLQLENVVVAKVNSYQDPQMFRIYSVEKNISKTVSVKCQHISYDMVNIPVKPFKVTGSSSSKPSTALTNLRNNAVYVSGDPSANRFTFSTDITSTEKFEFDDPRTMRAVLLNSNDSIKGTYGGDLVIDNYAVQLLQSAGEDRNVTINYGIDLVDMTQEYNNSEMITGILPYYRKQNNSGDDTIVYGDVTLGPGQYTVQKIEPVDLTEYFRDRSTNPSKADINAKAQEWVAKEEIGEPEISLTVSYAALGQDVRLHDAIRVRFPSMGIDKKAKVVKYKYDVLLERCVEVDVGKAKDSQYFNLMDASKLKKGLLPPDRIAKNSITSNKYAKGSVGGSAISSGAVWPEYHIPEYSVDHERLSRKEDPGGAAVVNGNIATDAVHNAEIKSGEVTGGTNGSLAGSTVTTGNVTSGINNSLGYANNYHSVTLSINPANRPEYFSANSMFAKNFGCNNFTYSEDGIVLRLITKTINGEPCCYLGSY